MKLKSITLVVLFGLWTAFTLAGSVWGFIILAGPNSVIRLDVMPKDNIILDIVAAFSLYLCGGGLWGWGIARLMNADAKSMVIACALSWSATGFGFAMAGGVALALGLISKTIRILPDCCHSTHYFFLSIFVPVIGIVSAINAYVVTGKLGFKEKRKSVGMYTGLAAALGFLTVGLILPFGFGWEVGNPVYGKYGMITLLLFCSIGGALAIGWVLEKSRIRLPGQAALW